MSSRDLGKPTAVSTTPPAFAASYASVMVDPEQLERVVAQELAPHVVAERYVGELGEDALQRQPGGVVARVHDLVGAAGVGEVDDVFGVVLRGERGGRVVEVRPLQEELDGQRRPRLAAVAG